MISPAIRTVMSSCIGIVFLFFIVHYMSSHLLSSASRILYPIIRVQHSVVSTLQKISQLTTSQKELNFTIESLQAYNDGLLAENIALQAQLHFEEQTQELLSFKQQYAVDNALLGHIIMRQSSQHEQSILVDRGGNHGISVDMVAVYKNCLVGRVTHVYPYYCKVVLITDPDCKIAAYCCNSKAQGIHVGINQKDATQLEYVPHLQPLKADDLVISSGEGIIFPQGFALGRIASFKLNGLYYDISVKPLLNFETLSYCYLIKKGS